MLQYFIGLKELLIGIHNTPSIITSNEVGCIHPHFSKRQGEMWDVLISCKNIMVCLSKIRFSLAFVFPQFSMFPRKMNIYPLILNTRSDRISGWKCPLLCCHLLNLGFQLPVSNIAASLKIKGHSDALICIKSPLTGKKKIKKAEIIIFLKCQTIRWKCQKEERNRGLPQSCPDVNWCK